MKPKIGFITDELTQDFGVAAAISQGLGVLGLELRSAWGRAPGQLTEQDLDTVKEIVKKHNCTLTAYCSPYGKEPLPGNVDEVNESRDRLAGEISRAERLGARYVRIFSFLRDTEPNPVAAGDVLREILKGVAPGTAEILIETGTLTNTPNIDTMLTCLDRISQPDRFRLGILWDPGNSIFSGFANRSSIAEFQAAADLIRHVHVKDPVRSQEYVKVGAGDVGWASLIPEMASSGFDGWLSLETHWRLGRILSTDERNRPWGDTFSRGGFRTTIECILELYRLHNE